MKQILFFGLKDDLLNVIKLIEEKIKLKYTLTGNFEWNRFQGIKSFDTIVDIPKLGIADSKQSTTSDSYLVNERGTPIEIRTIDKSGIKRIMIDQLENPDTILLTPGGTWNENTILSGRISTVSETKISQELMKRFMNVIKKAFIKVNAYWVGPEALLLLNEGKRLACASIDSPPEFDLKK
jgi:hypothetical protein